MFLFRQNRKTEEADNKQILNKELFNSSSKKKVIIRAAKESAEDQKQLLEEYRRVFKSKEPSVAR